MKKRILALLLATIMVIGTLAGCSNSGEGKDTTLGGTIAPVVTDAPDTTVPDTTAAPDTTVADEDDPKNEDLRYEPAVKVVGMNNEIFDDLGKTIAQLDEKYGGSEKVSGSEFSRVYKNNYGRYLWSGTMEDRMEGIVHTVDTIGGLDAIIKVKPSTIFVNADFPIKVSEIEDKYGVIFVTSYETPSVGGFVIQIGYNGCTIIINSAEKDMISESDTCAIEANQYWDSPFGDSILEIDKIYYLSILNFKTYGELYDTMSKWSGVTKLRIFNSNGDMAYEDYKDLPLNALNVYYDIQFKAKGTVYITRDYCEYSMTNQTVQGKYKFAEVVN